jgi:RNA polymerase sigma-70 factor, ECF subfamily
MVGASERTSASDAALVVAVGRFDQAALAEIYRRHAGSVLNLAARVIGSPSMAEEVVQDVFTTLWKDPDRFDSEKGSLRTFLLAITHRRAVDLIRSEESRRRREDRSEADAPAFDTIDREVEQMAVANQVRDALSSLGEGERRAIELAYFGGHTYREVAELLDQPEGTVKSRIRNGLRRLRVELVAAGVTDEP